jgi:hypothetical protein
MAIIIIIEFIRHNNCYYHNVLLRMKFIITFIMYDNCYYHNILVRIILIIIIIELM